MFSKYLKSLSILKKFLFINFIIFTIISLFTFIYLNNVQPNLIKKKSVKHLNVIDNTINTLLRLDVKFDADDIRKFLFSTRFIFQNLDRVIFFDNDLDLTEKLKFYKKNNLQRKKIAKNGQKKYFQLFNCEDVAKYIVEKSMNLNGNYKPSWE